MCPAPVSRIVKRHLIARRTDARYRPRRKAGDPRRIMIPVRVIPAAPARSKVNRCSPPEHGRFTVRSGQWIPRRSVSIRARPATGRPPAFGNRNAVVISRRTRRWNARRKPLHVKTPANAGRRSYRTFSLARKACGCSDLPGSPYAGRGGRVTLNTTRGHFYRAALEVAPTAQS